MHYCFHFEKTAGKMASIKIRCHTCLWEFATHRSLKNAENKGFCCNEETCCENKAACCGAQCCTDDAPCCKQGETPAYCNKDTMGCCGDIYGCVSPCPSQFDATGCQLSSPSLHDDLLDAPYALPDNIYRILRPDENPEGIMAEDPSAQKTVLSHVNCGRRPKYTSRFISTSASLDVAKYSKKRREERFA